MTSTEAVVDAVCATVRHFGRTADVTHDIGADRVSRRTDAPFTAVTDPDGSLPHEAYVEVAGSPELEITVYPDGDAAITVDGVEFRDVPAEQAPAFVRALHDGSARLRGRRFPPGEWLVVPLPDGTVHRELVLLLSLTPYLAGLARLTGRERPTPGTSG
ncbi:hypothetical protein V1J52_17545 [Streptomyces sp. TRM 70351]|uniref:hypothetical protein n=1 Tax=Streptomyces sp. TRM 70351 TaxID=3116552 RepID=UPI002E7BBCB0|nr:hypothetical protein [Streptomyces sp. TRM 70351]MEE1929966.1 hypothetical protein [Streptomyces sp. TRM 70351]